MKILIAVDGSTYTQKALEYLVAHPSMFVEGNELVCLHVAIALPGNVTRYLPKESVAQYFADEEAKVAAPVEAFFADRGLPPCKLVQRRGHASEEIVAAAAEFGAGLIVMGTRGHGAIGRALMGSVATKVIAESDVPVLLVK
jgi:nucleotide-binding universal stress UspA family protein